jgi:hypothetical protein
LKKHPEVERSRAAVADGVKAFDLITSRISRNRNPLAVYFPYSDWIIERWPNYFLPALDAFRVLGVPVDVLPYAPPLEESVYPYYPFHMNKDVLSRLLKEPTVLVLPNVSGFQQTDSDLIKSFVEQGGVIVAFGPQIPMGRSYERRELFGVEEGKGSPTHTAVIVRDPIGDRVKGGKRFALSQLQLPTWTTTHGRVIATFEDGSPAVVANKYERGTILTVLPDVSTAAQTMPELVRDVLDHAVNLRGISPIVDVVGSKENTDITVARTAVGFRVAVVNYEPREIDLLLTPIGSGKRDFEWIDLDTGKKVGIEQSLKVKIPGNGFRALEFRGN